MAALRSLLRRPSVYTATAGWGRGWASVPQLNPDHTRSHLPLDRHLRRDEPEGMPGKMVIYKAPWMQPLRLLVRLKIFQLGGFAALVIPLAQFAEEGSFSPETVAASAGVVVGATGASLALWYYSRRYIGEIALLPPYPTRVQVSTLDFWGNRENLLVRIRDIIPPFLDATQAELIQMANQVLVPLTVVGHRQLFLSLRHGHLSHKRVLHALLSGTLEASNFQDLLDKDSTQTKG